MDLYDTIRRDLLSTMKQEVEAATNGAAAKERVAQMIAALVDVIAIASVPFPASGKVAIITSMMDCMEREVDRFEQHLAKIDAEKAIERAKA